MDDAEMVRAFYDELAENYHQIYADWDASVRRQGRVLASLLEQELGPGRPTILDCTAGIGTQALGLALLGYSVHASDLSPIALERARAEAERLGVTLPTTVADVRTLGESVLGTFDVVMSCDNALPHLLTDDDLGAAFVSMADKVNPGGLCLISLRDYELLVTTRPTGDLPRATETPDGRRITFQVWEWFDDPVRYQLDLFLLRESPTGWKTTSHRVTYRALLRSDLEAALAATDLRAVTWHDPEDTGFHQPILTALKP